MAPSDGHRIASRLPGRRAATVCPLPSRSRRAERIRAQAESREAWYAERGLGCSYSRFTESNLPPTFHSLPLTFHAPSAYLAPTFRRLPPTIHRLPPTFHRPSTAFHRPSTAFHRPSTEFHRPSTAFHQVLALHRGARLRHRRHPLRQRRTLHERLVRTHPQAARAAARRRAARPLHRAARHPRGRGAHLAPSNLPRLSSAVPVTFQCPSTDLPWRSTPFHCASTDPPTPVHCPYTDLPRPSTTFQELTWRYHGTALGTFKKHACYCGSKKCGGWL